LKSEVSYPGTKDEQKNKGEHDLSILHSWYLTSTTSICTMCSMTSNNKQRVTIFMNPDITKHARAQAIVEDLTLTALVERALIKYLPKETVIKKVEI